MESTYLREAVSASMHRATAIRKVCKLSQPRGKLVQELLLKAQARNIRKMEAFQVNLHTNPSSDNTL